MKGVHAHAKAARYSSVASLTSLASLGTLTSRPPAAAACARHQPGIKAPDPPPPAVTPAEPPE